MDRFSGDYIRQQPEYRYLVHKDSLHRVIQTCVEDGEVKLRFGHVPGPLEENTVRLPERRPARSRSQMIRHAASAVYHLTTLQLDRLAAAQRGGKEVDKHRQSHGPPRVEGQVTPVVSAGADSSVPRGHSDNVLQGRIDCASQGRTGGAFQLRAVTSPHGGTDNAPQERTECALRGRTDTALYRRTDNAPHERTDTAAHGHTDNSPTGQKKPVGISDPRSGKNETLPKARDCSITTENNSIDKGERGGDVMSRRPAMARKGQIGTRCVDLPHDCQNTGVTEEESRGASFSTSTSTKSGDTYVQSLNDKSSASLAVDTEDTYIVENCREKSNPAVLEGSAAGVGNGTVEFGPAGAWTRKTESSAADGIRHSVAPQTNTGNQDRTRNTIAHPTYTNQTGCIAEPPKSPGDPVVNRQTTDSGDKQTPVQTHEVNIDMSLNDKKTSDTGMEPNSSQSRVLSKRNKNASEYLVADTNVVKEPNWPSVVKDKKNNIHTTPRAKSPGKSKAIKRQLTLRGKGNTPTRRVFAKMPTQRKKKVNVTASPNTSQNSNQSSSSTTWEAGQKKEGVVDTGQAKFEFLAPKPQSQPDGYMSISPSLQTAVSHYSNSSSDKQENCEENGDRKTAPQNNDTKIETRRDKQQKDLDLQIEGPRAADNANDEFPARPPRPLIYFTDTSPNENQQNAAPTITQQVDTPVVLHSSNDHPALKIDQVQEASQIDISEEKHTSSNCIDKITEHVEDSAENVDVFPRPVTRVFIVETPRQTGMPDSCAVPINATHCQQRERDASRGCNSETDVASPRFIIPVVVLDEASTDADSRSEYSDDADAVSIDADEYLALLRYVHAGKQRGEDSNALSSREENGETINRLTNRVLRNHNKNARSSQLAAPIHHPKCAEENSPTVFEKELAKRLEDGSEFNRRYSTPAALEAVGLRRSLTPSTCNVEFQSHTTLRPSTSKESVHRTRRTSSSHDPKEAQSSLLPPATHDTRSVGLKSAMSSRRSSLNSAVPVHCHWDLGMTDTASLSRQVSWAGHKASHGTATRRRSSFHVAHGGHALGAGHAGHGSQGDGFLGNYHVTGVIKEDGAEQPKSESMQSSRKHSETRRMSTVSAVSSGRRSLTAEEPEDHEILQHQMSQYDPQLEKAERYIHQRENTFNKASQYLSPVRRGLRNIQVHYSQTNTCHNDGIIFAHLLRAAHIRNTAVEEGVYTMERRLYTRRHATTAHATTFYDIPDVIKSARKGASISSGVCSPQTKKKKERRERIKKKNNEIEMGYTPTALSLKELGPEDIEAVRNQCRHLRVSPGLQQHLYSTCLY